MSSFRRLATVLLGLSNWEGRFPVDEGVSELPAVFWTTLREELCSSSSNDTNMVRLSMHVDFCFHLD